MGEEVRGRGGENPALKMSILRYGKKMSSIFLTGMKRN